MPRKGGSFVWNYCSKAENKDFASCNICKATFRIPGGSTTCLRKHLQSKHQIQDDNLILLEGKHQIQDDHFFSIETPKTHKKASFVWKFCSKTDTKDFASCDYCQARISTPHGSTTGLRKHLKNKHDIQDENSI